MQKFTKELIIAFIFGIAVIVGSNLAFAQQKEGIEWRSKPVQCGPESAFWPVLNSHNEKALIGNEVNNNKNIIHIPLSWNISINQANKSDTNLISVTSATAPLVSPTRIIPGADHPK